MISIRLWFELFNLIEYSSVRIALGVGVFLVEYIRNVSIYRVIKIRYEFHLFLPE